MARPVVLTENSIAQIAHGFQAIQGQLEHRDGTGRQTTIYSGKQVRVGRTVADAFSYPVGESNKYEIKLGEITFDEDTVGLETPAFVVYEGVETIIAASLDPVEIAENTVLLLVLIHNRYYILSPTDAEDNEGNPGVVTVEIDSVSPCIGELLADLGFHAFLATITSRPFGSPDEMRRETAGTLRIFDPTGCMLDVGYEVDDFLPSYGNAVTAFVSLMYGGEPYIRQFNFKGGSGRGDNDVLVDDDYATFIPANSCKPFGWVGGPREGYTAAIGATIPNGQTAFHVKLPERGIYEITLVYGDPDNRTYNLIEVKDGVTALATLTDRTDPALDGQTWSYFAQHNFVSEPRPTLIITLNNAPDANDVPRDSRIVSLLVTQISSPTRWEVINRCCIPRDLE